MSTPVRGSEGPLGYAPRWAQLRGDRVHRDTVPAGIPAGGANARGLAPMPAPEETPRTQAAEPPWKRRGAHAAFRGDVAIMELRERLALAPDQIPEPARPSPGGSVLKVVARLVSVIVLTGGTALGILWIATPHAAPPGNRPVKQVAGQGEAGQVSVGDAFASHAVVAQVDAASHQSAAAHEPPPKTVKTESVTLESHKGDRAAPATVGLAPSPDAASARRPDGTGAAPSAPALRVFPAAETRIAPPAAAPPSLAPDREETAALLVRGRAYIAEGDVAAARLVLHRAVERGDSQAALALGGTYDPLVLKRLGVISFAADPAQAREWYHKAAELGSADATLRLEQLAQIDR
jgi:hypothetical protein